MGSETTQWTFQSGGSTHIVTITADGRVIRNHDVTWDEAALCFWEAVERVRQAATPTLTADGEAVVERVRGHLVRLDDGDYTDMPDVVQDVSALLAHLQRQGTPVVVTEAMVEAAARAQYELEHTDLPWERCGSLFADGYREDARAVLTAALAARGEGE